MRRKTLNYNLLNFALKNLTLCYILPERRGLVNMNSTASIVKIVSLSPRVEKLKSRS